MLRILVLFFLCSNVYGQGLILHYKLPLGGTTISHSYGTCFAVNETQIVTAAHTILKKDLDKGTLEVTYNNKVYKVKIVKTNEDLDLALCDVLDVKMNVPILGDDATTGEVVFNGSYESKPVEDYKGTIIKRFYNGTSRDLATVKFGHGMSGCPVLQKGKVIGIALAGLPDKRNSNELDGVHGLYLPVSVVKWFIKN